MNCLVDLIDLSVINSHANKKKSINKKQKSFRKQQNTLSDFKAKPKDKRPHGQKI